MSKDFNETIRLPKTEFPMRAGLSKREPGMLADFDSRKLYEKLIEKGAGKPAFILHDGPPFSNGDIHIGTAMNKILKDFIVRYKNMSGFRAPYVPGWDNHGMPIESAIIKKNKLDRKKMSVPEFRDACRAFAADFIDRQRDEFRRLGIVGDWENPYLTMNPKFEADEIRVFGQMYEKGYIYKGLKPVYWCPSDETALAEAEIEYADVPCDAIFVRFKVRDSRGTLPENSYFVIWTTTAWTLPGNLAVCLHPDVEYSLVEADGDTLIVAEALAPSVMKAAGIAEYRVAETRRGREFERMTAYHPLYARDSLVIVGEHVTTETGTGCVHTAPGFGVDDYNVCRKYPEIEVVVPVDTRGIMTDEAGKYAGQHYSKAGGAILADLADSGALFASEKITHSYPHCWRCKNPIIFRAAEQWFASVDAIKDAASDACGDIAWLPAWGHDRMTAMIRERSDWCISRQRHWGLPIPVFICGDCGKPVCNAETTEAVASLFAERGSNLWFELPAEEILPGGFKCPHCGGVHFTKETDTLDGWFDSGSTHAAVLQNAEQFPQLQYPADVYLEGPDQFRGWFQSSLLTSVATRGVAPYRRVITHGWTVDGDGRAMHKSLGNAVAPDEVISEYGADILRLWVSSTDYRMDVRISKPILKQLSDIYLKIRNTARFILGNLADFDPDAAVPFAELLPLDRWALSRLDALVGRVRESYENYEYHTIYHGIHNFCAVDMSSFYLDVIKDRLYCDDTPSAVASASGKSARTAIYLILDSLVRLLAPVLAFTSEEIWAEMPHSSGSDTEFALLAGMPEEGRFKLSPEEDAFWEKLLALRDGVNSAMEKARADKVIGKSLDAELTVTYGADFARGYAEVMKADLRSLLIVSKAAFEPSDAEDGFAVAVQSSETPKCPRCWNHTDEPDADGLCPRCASVLAE
ncbi:MAG: isoleucine--tRNA ligase [Oscillospiraceae bacterium]|jgi:isoleucyl-tRNA synthetase|nr:isoleucine--tRNA ligase [Oscillospiraceae bacterium]